MDIMLNLPDTNNFLFLVLQKKKAYKHYIFKGGIHPLDRKEKMVMRTNFPCHKQPADSVYYGYYKCEHMRELGRYTKDPKRVNVYSLLGIDA